MPKFKEGDILVMPGAMYQHWAVYCGNRSVVHYAGNGSTVSKQMSNSQIVHSKLPEDMLKTFKVWKTHPNAEDRCEVVERAKSRIGEAGYNIAFNNCEHFAKWCDTGKSSSDQVSAVIETAAGVVGTTAVGLVGSGLVVPTMTISAGGDATAVASVSVTVLPQLAGPTFTVLMATGPIGLVIGGGIAGAAGAAGLYVAYKWLSGN